MEPQNLCSTTLMSTAPAVATPMPADPVPHSPTRRALPARRSGIQHRVVQTSDGVAIAVSDWLPDGPVDHTVFLLHGLCLTRHSWQGVVRRLRRPGIRVVYYDHRGHGSSGRAAPATYSPGRLAQDLAEIVTALRISGPLTIAGHSMGGIAALSYLARAATEQPVRPCGLVLVATAAAGLTDHGVGRVLALPGIDTLLDVIDHIPHTLCEHVMRGLARPLCDVVTGDRKVAAALAQAFRATPAATALGFLRTLKTFDQRAVLPAISAATTVISGSADILTPPVHGEEMAAAIPGATHLLLAHAGHMLLHEACNTVSDAILRTTARTRDGAVPA